MDKGLLFIIGFIMLSVIIGIIELKIVTRKPSQLHILCSSCRHCVTKTHRPYYHSQAFSTKVPTYCKLMRKQLPQNPNTRCQLPKPSDEFYEN